MRYAVIMAGGAGTRLWPLSRKERPKQLLHLFDGASLLRRSFERLRAVLPAEQIHVIANGRYADAVRAELPEMPADNFIAEPCARDTANAVGLAAHLLAARDPEGTMGVFTADHVIEPVDRFAETVRRGFETAEKHDDALVTFGIRPRVPHTGYGYIRRGAQVEDGVFEVAAFVEKPDSATADRYVSSGEYNWNSGMFVWRLETVLAQFRRHQQSIDEGLGQVASDFADPDKADAVRERFARLPKISVDFAIMEKADRVLTVEMTCRWLDVGSWSSLPEIIAPDRDDNTRAAPNVQILDSGGNIVVSESDHLIALLGVEDLIIAHADDATVICHRSQAQRIKELVERVRATAGERYM